jgi:hypothetical protein
MLHGLSGSYSLTFQAPIAKFPAPFSVLKTDVKDRALVKGEQKPLKTNVLQSLRVLNVPIIEVGYVGVST